MVVRYSVRYSIQGYDCATTASHDGHLVSYSDYETLEARCSELEAERDNFRDAAAHWASERKLREEAYDVRDDHEGVLRSLKESQAHAQKLTEALERLINACHSGRRVERGAGGMTLESQLHRTVINGVPAMAVEDAYEALSLTPTSALAAVRDEAGKKLAKAVCGIDMDPTALAQGADDE